MGVSKMPDPLVRAASIARVYGTGHRRVHALSDATFTIWTGDTIAVLGPSGSGKSTLLHLIAGLEVPSTGSISWPAIGDRSALRPGPVGFSFQGPSLLPPLSVLENVALPVILAGGSDADARAEARELLEAFSATELADRLPEELSGGQSQRVGLARAFAGSPTLVLADEPTGQQDHASGERIVEVALSLIERARGALVVATHDRTLAEQLGARWIMRDGALQPEDLSCSA
jgi:ABC-type lipoprotein export system ATPase subunit